MNALKIAMAIEDIFKMGWHGFCDVNRRSFDSVVMLMEHMLAYLSSRIFIGDGVVQ